MVLEQGRCLEPIVPYLKSRFSAIMMGFELNDAHIGVLHMITHDLLRGEARTWPLHPGALALYKEHGGALPQGYRLPLHPDARIDLEWYMEQYDLLRSVIRLARYLADVAKGEQDGTG
jgi:hypothetical protein